jgi:membrane protease YdiL (CAAX protease family)
MSQPRQFHRVWLYVLIAYAVSWAIEIPLALKAQGVPSPDVPFSLHYLAAFGPFVAGLIATWRENGVEGLRELGARMVRWRVAPVWWIVALSPLLVFFAISGLKRVVEGAWLDIGMLGRVDFLPDLGAGAVVLWLATYGFGEEVGWRGYLLPRLQRDRTAWRATIILWAIWALWHVPSFFYLHTVSGPTTLVGFLLGVFAGAVVLTWLYNSSGGSILMVAIWHGLFDYVTACTECKSGVIAAVLSTAVMICAAVIVPVFKPTDLSRHRRHVL